MRIGLFSDTFLPIVDGVGRVVYNYADCIANKGHTCYVIAPRAEAPHPAEYPFHILDFYSMPLISAPQYKIGLPTLDRKYVLKVNKTNLNIVHAHSPFIAGKEALRIAKKFKLPIVGTFHSKYYDDFYKMTGNEELASLGLRYVVDFYSKCDEVWVVSKSSGEVLKSYGYKGDYVVMPNGVCISEPDNTAAEEVTKRYGLGNDTVLLFVGQINWKKNIMRILQACALLKNSGTIFKLVMAGQGPDEDEIKEKVQEHGLEQNTIFTGHITDQKVLNGLYTRATLFVFPSLYDNAPMVLREAACMETPAVLARGSCASEVIDDGVNGFLCDDTPQSLFETIKSALQDQDKLKQIGKAARQTIPISWDLILDSALERYENLIVAKQEYLKRKEEQKARRLAKL